jgi:hypothetical protein
MVIVRFLFLTAAVVTAIIAVAAAGEWWVAGIGGC